MRGYYWRWFRTAVCHSYGWSEKLTGVIGIFGPPIVWMLGLRDRDAIVDHLAWQMPLATFVLVSAFRAIAAPYWMHKEDEVKRGVERAEEEKELTRLEGDRNQLAAVLDARVEDKRRRDEQKDCLAKLIKAGEHIRHRGEYVLAKEQVSGWLTLYEEWIKGIQSEVGHAFSIAEVEQLLALRGSISEYARIAHTGPHQEALARITAILDKLHEKLDAIVAKG